jgi:hypothetical protein
LSSASSRGAAPTPPDLVGHAPLSSARNLTASARRRRSRRSSQEPWKQ